ncbi:GNAT family N-acetyltransferase [Dokdonella sp.]|uniref:GNAT family N-acetyltransferase n=1 Tax=Dokdonella sp. TaxID=2291710 RepID=UPI0031CA7F55|nr:GNAT family N-acetyltransferase [Dokdonella sp.]
MDARFHAALDQIPAAAWNALLSDDNPFLDHAFLAGLERHGCIDAQAGWQPHHLGLYEGGQLVAAAPLYLKGNSHGEFVFDWRWAEAYLRHGLDYYPKLLCGVPYSPVTGPRLLAGTHARAPALRAALVRAMEAEAARLGLSSAHLNFATPIDAAAFDGSDWLARFDWQFHWHHRGWRDFDDFLAALSHRKRNNIRHERRRVAAAGVRCVIRHGDELGAADWRALHGFYLATFGDHGNYPALTLEFFRHLGQALPRRVLAVLCLRGDDCIAGALFLRSAHTLYGRYWGASEHVPGLHFEACYYQGIEYCLHEGLAHFEPGAQGEHKLARGFIPVRTRSFHWIADPRFRAAIGQALEHEALALDDYHEELLARSPYARRA